MIEPPPFVPPADRPTELPLDDFQSLLCDVVERFRKKIIRNCARNAFVHLKKAWRLHPLDSEMCLFRAITAEEEAASALINALKQQKYPGAKRLNHRSHIHKSAVWPVFEAIALGASDKKIIAPKLSIRKVGDPFISIEMNVASMAGLDESLWATPDHPFNFLMYSDENGPFEVHRWEKEFSALAGKRGQSKIFDHIEDEANLRNRILYASDEGVPSIRFSNDVILERLKRVTWLLVATIGVMQTQTSQLFIVQTLESLLLALGRFEGQGFSFPEHKRPEGLHLYMEERAEGGMSMEFGKSKE